MLSRRIVSLIVLLSVLLVLAGCDSGQPAATPTPTAVPTTGQIEGRVYRSDTDKPVVNATVNLRDATKDSQDPEYEVAEATTDADGHYTFTDLNPGEYVLGVSLDLKDISDSPCQSGGYSFYKRDGAAWVAVLGYRDDGSLVLVVIGDTTYKLAAGDLIQKNIDLYCLGQ